MRSDGKRLRNLDGEYVVSPHFMVERNDALNYTALEVPFEPIQKYINKKRNEGVPLSHMSVILSAYSRTVGEFPLLNRFVVNRKFYARKELSVTMVVLRSGSDDGGTYKVKLDPNDTVFDTHKKVTEFIEHNRKDGDSNSSDKIVNVLLKIPGLLFWGVKFFKWADKHGLLPFSIIDASPFHASMGLTNLASIRTDFIYHHPYNFGTIPFFFALGTPKEVPVKKNGEITFEKVMPIGCAMDERICTGLYYSTAFKKFKKYLANPELLEEKPDPAKVIKETPYREDIKQAKLAKKEAKKARKAEKHAK